MGFSKKIALALAMMTLLLAGCNSTTGSPTPPPEFSKYVESHFGFFRAFKSYPFVDELNVHWERPHPGPFIWGEVERIEGDPYDWSAIDKYVQDSQKNRVVLVATIWPYANWDQERCHTKLPDERRLFPILGDYRGKPCDPEAYRRFVKALVERYDGDGIDDMPGLVYPIKYWEVINEPDLEKPVFFKGNPQLADYLEVLQTTHDAIRQSDPDAKVLNGGIASLAAKEKPFWQALLGGPGAQYIDVLTIHSIELGADLQLPALNELMKSEGLNQPVWVTEIQYSETENLQAWQQAQSQGAAAGGANASVPESEDAPVSPADGAPGPLNDLTQDQWSAAIVQSFTAAFGNGAQKLFYIGLDNGTPTEDTSLLVNCQTSGVGPSEPYDPAKCERQKPFYAYKTMVDKIDYFDSVQKIAEGQFRFSVGGRNVYVLWGNQPLPAEISGPVRVTDIYGQEQQIDARNLVLSDTPIYVEASG